MHRDLLSLVFRCQHSMGTDLETQTNAEALAISATILFKGCFVPQYFKIFREKTFNVIEANIPNKEAMLILKYSDFQEFNIKEDADLVRVLSILHDEALLFIDPMNKALEILS